MPIGTCGHVKSTCCPLKALPQSFQEYADFLSFLSGGWRVDNRARFNRNFGDYPTPYGENLVQFFDFKNGGLRGTVSQDITGLVGGSTYTLRYGYHNWYNYFPCTITVTLGSQFIDSVTMAPANGDPRPFKVKRKSFVAQASSGTLTFKNECVDVSYTIDLDYISLTGPA